MKHAYFFTILFFLAMLNGRAQSSNSDWVTYLVQKEKGPMILTSNLYYNFVGKPNYKNLLIVGTNTKNCKKNGYPDELGLAKFYMLSDSISNRLDRLTKKRLVGIVTYQCSGFDIYYLKDTLGVRNSLQSYLDYNYAFSKNYLLLKYDRKWQYYKENLVPKDVSDAFFANHEFLNQLAIEGDNLKQPRKVNHWVNFRNTKQRDKFINNVKALKFTVDSLKTLEKQYYKYQVQISRKDTIHPKAIDDLTKALMKLSYISAGIYDGWGAEAIKED